MPPHGPVRPDRLMLVHAENLFPDAEEREAFIQCLIEGQSREQAIIVLDDHPAIGAFPKKRPLPWQPPFVVRIADAFRPAQHALHAKGAYYCFDFSSAFAVTPLMQIQQAPRRVLDVCSSPGGKAIFAWRLFRDRGLELVVCNETIRKRTGTLIGNLERCKVHGSVVGSADPSVWSRRFPESFDLVLVDAPCSGQSLLAKGDDAPGCFAPQMIEMNHSRQRRILGVAAQCLRPGGHLLYTTCTYAIKENEKVVAWLLREYDWLEAVEVPSLEAHRSVYGEAPSYRLFPQSRLGAGAFACLFRRKGEVPAEYSSLDGMPTFWRLD